MFSLYLQPCANWEKNKTKQPLPLPPLPLSQPLSLPGQGLALAPVLQLPLCGVTAGQYATWRWNRWSRRESKLVEGRQGPSNSLQNPLPSDLLIQKIPKKSKMRTPKKTKKNMVIVDPSHDCPLFKARTSRFMGFCTTVVMVTLFGKCWRRAESDEDEFFISRLLPSQKAVLVFGCFWICELCYGASLEANPSFVYSCYLVCV